MTTVIALDALQDEGKFEGYLNEDAGASFLLADVPPGGGPTLHRHDYAEVFLVQEGQARFTAGSETLDVLGGHVVVVPSGTPHKFVNIGTGQLRVVDIHAAKQIKTEWLEE
jgi:mannose-6-phosphate isomerase-like protein (cupin superfamily)